MTQDHTATKIVEFLDRASGPYGRGELMRLVFRLRPGAPPEWTDRFNLLWRDHVYEGKREARAEVDKLEIVCSPEEIEERHLPELKKIVALTNEHYKEYLERRNERRRKADEESKKITEGLTNLKSKLKFD
jgi:hypothetical protein